MMSARQLGLISLMCAVLTAMIGGRYLERLAWGWFALAMSLAAISAWRAVYYLTKTTKDRNTVA